MRTSRNDTLRWRRSCALGAVAIFAGLLCGTRGLSQTDAAAVKSDFGIVIAHSGASVQLQVYNDKNGEVEIHRYMRTADTQSDVLHAGDQVQVLFVLNGQTRILRRATILPAPLDDNAKKNASNRSGVIGKPTTAVSDLSRNNKRATVKLAKQANLPSGVAARGATTGTSNPAALELGGNVTAKVPTVISVPLGIDGGYGAKATQPVSRSVAFETPAAACHGSDKDWPTAPLRIVVLDFRYPAEREDAHDVGTASGGSGMAVADLVYARLKRSPEFEVDRGDRRRLDRTDIAGAARLGRELGADAVLEGTFFPVDGTAGSEGAAVGVKGYELHAGVVDTCTGQVLLKLRSEDCTTAPGCRPMVLSPEVAQDPGAHAAAVGTLADALLAELEGSGPAATEGAGSVVGVWNGKVTVRMAAGTVVKTGDRLSVRATRLAKNPTTYTLQYKRAGEIGWVVVRHVDGLTASGGFEGDIPPKVGDRVEVVRQ